MVDPVTAIAAATTAFNAIKKGFQFGRDVESMSGDLGRWMGAVSDIDKADQYAKKPPLFKKRLNVQQVVSISGNKTTSHLIRYVQEQIFI